MSKKGAKRCQVPNKKVPGAQKHYRVQRFDKKVPGAQKHYRVQRFDTEFDGWLIEL